MHSPPIFLIGPLRSGTTLLRLILGRHSQLNFFGEFEGAVSQAVKKDWPNLNDYHEFCMIDRQIRELNLKIDKSLGYRELVNSFLDQLRSRSNKPFIGASIHSRIDMLPKLWPEAKFIHLLRDPRDVARSCIGMGWVGNVFLGADYWIKSETYASEVAQNVPKNQYITIRYEQLVENPSEHIEQICHFLNVDYEPQMLSVNKDSTYSKPDPSYANQWKTRLSKQQITWVESKCYDLMIDKGYRPEYKKKQVSSYVALLLKFQNRLYRVKFGIKKYGLRTWLAYALSKRAGNKTWQQSVQLRKNEIDKTSLK